MAPRLRDGDWLLVDPEAYLAARPLRGDLVLARSDGGLLVKRVAAVEPGGGVLLTGDAAPGPGHDHDAEISIDAVAGRPWFRYWPLGRIGRVR